MGSPNNYQVGGNHYKTIFEHWDWVEQNGIGYLEGCATKYVARWRNKNGLEDLKKARHYVMKTLELYQKEGRKNRCNGQHVDEYADFAAANHLPEKESVICLAIGYWSTDQQLLDAVRLINELIQEHFPQEFAALSVEA